MSAKDKDKDIDKSIGVAPQKKKIVSSTVKGKGGGVEEAVLTTGNLPNAGDSSSGIGNYSDKDSNANPSERGEGRKVTDDNKIIANTNSASSTIVADDEAAKQAKSDKDFRRLIIAFVVGNLLFVILAMFLKFLQSPWYMEVAQVSNGYGAKISCSLNFLPHANRSQDSIDNTELYFPPIIFLSSFTVDNENKCVTGTSRLNYTLTQTACYRNQQLGCVLLNYNSPEAIHPYIGMWTPRREVSNLDIDAAKIDDRSGNHISDSDNNNDNNNDDVNSQTSSQKPWPFGEGASTAEKLASALEGVDLNQIDKLVTAHMNHTKLHARAFLLIRDGVLIYERYGDNAGPKTPMIGWSCTKSITSTLLGIRSFQSGKFDLNTDTSGSFNSNRWIKNEESSNNASCGGDASGSFFSVGRMLRMSEGLDFDEDYTPGSMTTTMLFTSASTSDIISSPPKRRAASSGRSCFQYSSLTTNLLQKFLKQTFADEEDGTMEYLQYPQRELFDRIGVTSATMETDPTNTFVGSSFSYMNARDWAKLGLLWLNDGVWPSFPITRRDNSNDDSQMFEGTRMLPEGWMAFARSPTPTSNGAYGAQFWLGGNERTDESDPHSLECDKLFPTRTKPPKTWLRESFPPNSGIFMAHGFEEQLVAMAPKKGLVMVRLGASKEVVIRWEKEKIALYRGVMDAIADKY